MLGLFRRSVKGGTPSRQATPEALLAGRVVVNGVPIDAQSTSPYVRSVSLHNECHHLAGMGL
jgi:hypothetical protein